MARWLRGSDIICFQFALTELPNLLLAYENWRVAYHVVQAHPHGPILVVPSCPTDFSWVAGAFVETLRIPISLSDIREGVTQRRCPKTETRSVGLTRAPIILLARVAWAESPKQA